MADGTYERRGPREAELKRFRRIIEAAQSKADQSVASATPAAQGNDKLSGKGESR